MCDDVRIDARVCERADIEMRLAYIVHAGSVGRSVDFMPSIFHRNKLS
jgi:hypothetical protein